MSNNRLVLGDIGEAGVLQLLNKKKSSTLYINGESGFIDAEGIRIGDLIIGSKGSTKNTHIKGIKGKIFFDQKVTMSTNLDVSGNIGIGTNAPRAKLEVNGDIRIDDNTLWLRGGSNDHGIGYYGVRNRDKQIFANTDIDGPVIFGWNGGALGTTADGNQKIELFWSKQGNVGIGTTSPQNKLQVEGDLHVNGHSIFLRENADDKFDLIKWNRNEDKVDIGGYNGVNLCCTGGGANPNPMPVLSIDPACNLVIRDKNNDELMGFHGKDAFLNIGNKNNFGNIAVLGTGGIHRFRVAGGSGEVTLRDENNNATIIMQSHIGDIILGGADCAENFEMVKNERAEPGSVLVIGNDGKLCQCIEPYDKKVAGVVSGASEIKPGIILNGKQRQDNSLPIALSGKVYCKVDAQHGPIEVGDLLTTSSTRGHAMKAADPGRAFGTVIGKALCELAYGKGMIPILVALQ